jgi:hypothetical protein
VDPENIPRRDSSNYRICQTAQRGAGVPLAFPEVEFLGGAIGVVLAMASVNWT